MTVAQKLAEFVQSTAAVPPTTRSIARHAVLDLVTAAIVGYDTQSSHAARRAACSIWGAGPASCWFSNMHLTVPGAAYVNATAASSLDLDDGHRAAAGHPGASVIPAVIATAQTLDTSASRLETAIAIGYEVAVRIAAARDLSSVDTLVSGRWCGQGAAAAAAWLRGLSAKEIEQAIAIAGSCAPNLSAVAHSQVMGNHVKEGIPWATATGLTAVELAAQGFTGPTDLLDHAPSFDRSTLLEGLADQWLIEGIYFKPYSCCRWAHAAIDAILHLQDTEELVAEEIQSIKVHTFARALQLNNEPAPANLEAAQYSVPFCLALAVLRGKAALLPLQEVSLKDNDVISLAQKVELSIDAEFDAMFSESVPARLEVLTARGQFRNTVLAPKGEPSNPMAWDELKIKMHHACNGIIPLDDRSALIAAIEAFEKDDIRPLLASLKRPFQFSEDFTESNKLLVEA